MDEEEAIKKDVINTEFKKGLEQEFKDEYIPFVDKNNKISYSSKNSDKYSIVIQIIDFFKVTISVQKITFDKQNVKYFTFAFSANSTLADIKAIEKIKGFTEEQKYIINTPIDKILKSYEKAESTVKNKK